MGIVGAAFNSGVTLPKPRTEACIFYVALFDNPWIMITQFIFFIIMLIIIGQTQCLIKIKNAFYIWQNTRLTTYSMTRYIRDLKTDYKSVCLPRVLKCEPR